ncbi:YggT family protein [Chloroflexota bacterium]
MGRPWWYDSYWQKDKKPKRRFSLPNRKAWVWIAIVVLALLMATNTAGFRTGAISWFLGFIYYLCRILSFAIFLRAIVSWFIVGRDKLLVILLDDATDPILSPLRQVIPRLGMFDITPVIAIAILYFIPAIIISLMS